MATEYVTREEFDALAADVRTCVTLDRYNAAIAVLIQAIGTLPEDTEATSLVEYVDEKTNVPEYKLSLTASELAEKLSAL